MDELERITLSNLAGGGAEEIFARELASVITNIQDVNTMHKEKREITIKITVLPNEQRTSAELGIAISTKLAKPIGIGSTMFLQHRPGGETVGVEYHPEQVSMFAKQEDQPKNKMVVVNR